MKIKLNILEAEFNLQEMDFLFGILIMKHDSGRRVWASSALDISGEDRCGVMSVCYRGECIYFLVSQADGNAIRKRLCSHEDGTESFTMELVSCSELISRGYQSVVLQLLLNSVPAVGGDPLCDAANLTGRLLCHHSAWKSKDGFGKPLHVAMEIRIDRNMCAELPVTTFSCTEREKDYKKRPFYQLEKNGSMKRIYKPKKSVYVMKRFDSGRSDVPFLLLKDEDAYGRCKVGVLNRMLEKFDALHGRYCSLSFREVETDTVSSVEDAISRIRENNKGILEDWLDKCRGVRVKDLIGSSASASAARMLREMLGEHHSPDGDCELHLVHEKEWYSGKGMEDPYSSSSGVSVQHVALETIMSEGELLPSASAVLENCISNLIVKDDLCKGRMSLGKGLLDEGVRYAFGTVVGFPKEGEEQDDRNNRIVVFMEVCDGRISFREGRLGSADVLLDADLSSVALAWEDEFCGMVFKDQSVMAICDTGLFTIPELRLIREELKRNSMDGSFTKKNKISRGKEARRRFFGAVTDINVFRMDGSDSRYYNVGVIGKGMNSKIPHASRVREIRLLEGEDFSDEILPMMTELHVRNGQMSVLPFPFKYLREAVEFE